LGDRRGSDEQSREALLRSYAQTPQGKAAKALHDKEAADDGIRRADDGLKKLRREEAAHVLEQNLLNRGFDVHCSENDLDRTLLVFGPSVNRVFAHDFMQTGNMRKTLQEASFAGVAFFNEATSFSEKYEVGRP
jgi:hypothetical protein